MIFEQISTNTSIAIGIISAFIVILITCYEHSDVIAEDSGILGLLSASVFLLAFIWRIAMPIYMITAIIAYVIYPWTVRRHEYIKHRK